MTLPETPEWVGAAVALCLLAGAAGAQQTFDCPGPGCPGHASPAGAARGVGRNEIILRIDFPSGTAAVPDDQKGKLIDACRQMQDRREEVLRIIGHTDASGPASYNQRLSEARAESVKSFLVERCGYAADTLETVGMGETAPLDPSDPYSPLNRRIEIRPGS